MKPSMGKIMIFVGGTIAVQYAYATFGKPVLYGLIAMLILTSIALVVFTIIKKS